MKSLVVIGQTALAAAVICGVCSQAAAQSVPTKELLQIMIARERTASTHRGYYAYLSEERSDRTGGHLWTERNAETSWGTVRYLVEEDGKPITGTRLSLEREKLSEQAKQPEMFRREAAKQDEDAHAQRMLELLTKTFLFGSPRQAGQELTIPYRPDPDYEPATMEERALHSMSGSVVIEVSTLRLASIDGRVLQDVSLGFGPLATLHGGSEFSTRREHVGGDDWKTENVHTSIKGRALFIKAIARQQETTNSAFRKLPDGTTLGEAVNLVEQ